MVLGVLVLGGCGVDGFDEQERRNVEWCWLDGTGVGWMERRWNVEWVER